MNSLLGKLRPYPFDRWQALAKHVVPSTNYRPIGMGMGEPKHPAPSIVTAAIASHVSGVSSYPPPPGGLALREAIGAWISRRYGVSLDPVTQVLSINGSREALFAIAQAVVDSDGRHSAGLERPVVVCPNPFYQIYEGAALLAGAETAFANCDSTRNFSSDWASVDEAKWRRTQLLFVCTPGNPTGAVMRLEDWKLLFSLSDRYGFVIASDECYSEIYFGSEDEAPLGALDAANKLGRADFRNLVVFSSLSKRSNLPGLRSGFVAGDAEIIKGFLLYRTYHGCAMSPVVQAASIAAWSDEAHVRENRVLYRRKFATVTEILSKVLDVRTPEAGFYLWAGVPEHVHFGNDVELSLGLLKHRNVTVLPGSLIARESNGNNPGRGRIRLALVAEEEECAEAAVRIQSYIADLA